MSLFHGRGACRCTVRHALARALERQRGGGNSVFLRSLCWEMDGETDEEMDQMDQMNQMDQMDQEDQEHQEHQEDDDESSLDSSAQSAADGAYGALGAAASGKTRAARTKALAARIHAKLCVPDGEALAVKAHRHAVRCMLELRDLLGQLTSGVDQEVRVLLLTAGVAVQRRAALSVVQDEEHGDLVVTLALLFVLQVLCDPVGRASPEPTGPVTSPSLRRCAEEEETDVDSGSAEADAPPECVPDETPSDIALWDASTIRESVVATRGRDKELEERWDSVLRLTPELVSRATLAAAPFLGADGTLAKMTSLATTFFRSSALAMQYSLLQGSAMATDAGPSFLTLGTVDFLQQVDDAKQEKRLAAIVDAAESEAGQQVCTCASPERTRSSRTRISHH